ncbi:MAG: MFS transporter [Candidatus Thorarchaeota archaeon]
MGRITAYFGLSDDKPEVISLAVKFVSLSTSMTAAISISATFYLIFVAETLGDGSYIDGLALAGLLIVVQKAVQTLFDYPTGIIGDLVGQRWVLSSAFLTYSAAFYIVSLISSSSQLGHFLLVYVLMGFAASQESGVIDSWFDSNYSAAVPEDTNKTEYGVFIGKLAMLLRVSRALVILPGAIFAVLIARVFVFQMQSIICILLAISAFVLVTDLPTTHVHRESESSVKEYVSLLRLSAKHVISSPFLKYIILGNTLFLSIGFTWGELIMYPFLYEYLLSDVAVASLMTIVIVVFAVFWERSGVWAKRFEPERWIHRFRFVQSAGAVFFWLFAILMLVCPPPTVDSDIMNIVIPFTDILILQVPSLSATPVLLILVIWFSGGIFFTIAAILWMRVLIDVIPNRIRNGVYSLLPTLVVLAAMPQVALLGWLVPLFGIPIVLALSGLVSTTGVLLLRLGFSFQKPLIEQGSE